MEQESNKTNGRPWARRFLTLSLRALALLGFLMALVTFTPIDDWWARKLEGPASVIPDSSLTRAKLAWFPLTLGLRSLRSCRPALSLRCHQ
jgi:hypothetical protein